MYILNVQENEDRREGKNTGNKAVMDEENKEMRM